MISLILIGCLVLFLLIDMPIAIAIGLSSMLAFLAAGQFDLMTAVQRMYAGADSFPLMAVPLFMIAGVLMEAGGISRRIINLADALVGWMPGGLAAVAVAASMFFAGISGSAAADTAAVGSILIPSMVRKGYDRNFAGAVQAAGGSIGVVIPPSIPMIIFGFLTGASIGKLFAAGILPGLLMGLTLIAVSTYVSRVKGYRSNLSFSFAHAGRTFLKAFWALGAPVIILGGILGGVFTATESAAVAVMYGLFVGLFIYRQIKFKDLPRLFIDAAVMSGVIMFIIAAASVFSWLMAIEDIPATIAKFLLSLSGDRVVLLLIINLVLLIAGTFVETTAALILLVPVIAPMAGTLGIDLVQMGAIIVVNLAIGMLTPPLGICLIVSCGIAGNRLTDISRSVVPFLAVLIADLLLITFWPPLTTWIPSVIH